MFLCRFILRLRCFVLMNFRSPLRFLNSEAESKDPPVGLKTYSRIAESILPASGVRVKIKVKSLIL